LNGARLNAADFTATNGTTVVLGAGALVGDTVDIIVYGPVSVANTYTQAETNALLTAKLNLAGGAMTGPITTNSTFDGVDVAARDAVLTTTTTTANAALPKTGGAMTGAITTNSTFDGVDVAARDAVLTTTTTTANAALPKAGGATTGDVSVGGELVATSYNETFLAVTSTSNATTVDCEAGNTFSHTLTEDTTFTFSNPPSSGTAYAFTLKIVQDSTARAITWSASVDWPAATAPTISTGSGEVDVFVFLTHNGGTTWYGFTAGVAMA